MESNNNDNYVLVLEDRTEVKNANETGKLSVVSGIDDKGKLTGRGFRISDPSLKNLDNAAQLTIIWKSPRPYQKTSNTALDTASALGNAVLNINETEK